MLKPVPWNDFVPTDFQQIVWQGNKTSVYDCPAVMYIRKQASIIKLELTEEDRRQLIEGNPIYLSMMGRVVPFMVSVNLHEITEVIRSFQES